MTTPQPDNGVLVLYPDSGQALPKAAMFCAGETWRIANVSSFAPTRNTGKFRETAAVDCPALTPYPRALSRLIRDRV
jgi:hypothetical protein